MKKEFIQMRSKLAASGYITLDKCGCSECTEDDACTEKVKRSVKVWPSARASQMVAKCRKAKGQVRKTEKGSSSQKVGEREVGQDLNRRTLRRSEKGERVIAGHRKKSQKKLQKQKAK